MPPIGFEPTIPASARPHTYALGREATGIGPPSNIAHKTDFQFFYINSLKNVILSASVNVKCRLFCAMSTTVTGMSKMAVKLQNVKCLYRIRRTDTSDKI
jgi:hypothetical protein